MDHRPIGIFDSGLGGLTAAKALEEIMPGEHLIYFGDSANAPYGTRTRDDLARLACANADFLRGFDCKAILVACGTVSSNAMNVLRGKYNVPFFGVIEAACRRACEVSRTRRVAVIATEATIRSDAFAGALRAIDGELAVFSKPCQSLVTVCEAGHFSLGDPVGAAAVADELAPVRAWEPDVLILACTHFPLLQPVIAQYMGGDVTLLSVGEETARELKAALTAENRLSSDAEGAREWYTSGDADYFSAQAEIFLGHPIQAAHHTAGGQTV